MYLTTRPIFYGCKNPDKLINRWNEGTCKLVRKRRTFTVFANLCFINNGLSLWPPENARVEVFTYAGCFMDVNFNVEPKGGERGTEFNGHFTMTMTVSSCEKKKKKNHYTLKRKCSVNRYACRQQQNINRGGASGRINGVNCVHLPSKIIAITLEEVDILRLFRTVFLNSCHVGHAGARQTCRAC